MDPPDEIVAWLLEGDVSVQYQTRRDLLDDDVPELQSRMAVEGYVAALLEARSASGDPRLGDAVEALVSLRRPDGTWPAGRTWPGETHVPMGRPERSRFVTLQALRVLRRYG